MTGSSKWRPIVTGSKSSRRYLISATFLLLLFFAAPGGGQTVPAGIQVEMNPQKPLWLRVTLESLAGTRVSLYKSRLPWGSRYSMVLAAVTPSGQYLDKELIIDDPSPEKVSLDPKGSLTGDINLQKAFRGLDGALRKSDVLLFWAYEGPEELHIAHWSGGWILIPQRH